MVREKIAKKWNDENNSFMNSQASRARKDERLPLPF